MSTNMKENQETEIRLVNYFDDHWYDILTIDGRFFIASVTTKLGIERKTFLERWRGDVGNKAADEKIYESQQKGKRIHHAMYVFLNGGTVIYDPWEFSTYTQSEIEKLKSEAEFFFALKNQDEMLALHKIQRFIELTGAKVIDTEMTVFDTEADEAGTLDAALFFEKGSYLENTLKIAESGVVIADLKTGSQVDPSAWSQISVYEKNYAKMKSAKTIKTIGGMILHTGANTKKGISGFSTPFKSTDELKPFYDVYKHLAAVWKARNPNKGPRVLEFPALIRGRKKESTK